MNVAVTVWSAFMERTQFPVPVQPPLQLPNVEGEIGLGVRVTVVLTGKAIVQAVGQLIPAGLLVTVPLPVMITVRFFVTEGEVKLAVTDWSAFITRVQVPVPEQAPPQPVKVEGAVGVAVKVTDVPG